MRAWGHGARSLAMVGNDGHIGDLSLTGGMRFYSQDDGSRHSRRDLDGLPWILTGFGQTAAPDFRN